MIARLGLAAQRQGAGAVRIESPEHIAAAHAIVRVPIVGFHKQVHGASPVYITPTRRAVEGVIVPVVAEGRIKSAADVRDAFRAGAYAVVVGGVATGVDALIRSFVEAAPSGLEETLDV